MRLAIRLLLVLPFLCVVCLYYKFHDPDNVGYGLADFMIDIFFYIGLIVTGCLALFAALRKRSHEILSAEPITLSLIMLAILILVYNATLRGHTNGETWIYSENKQSNQSLSNQSLTLKHNRNFTLELHEADFGCSISGVYDKHGDTIFLDAKAVAKTDETITSIYLLDSNKLAPLFDTANKIIFYVKDVQ